ncbi:MAG: pyridoxal phosphate-dependent aminotransferase [Candidatus Micrarchaeia archaeon]
MQLYSRRANQVEYSIREVELLARKYNSKDMILLNIGDPVRMGVKTPKQVMDAAINAIRSGYNSYSKSQGDDTARGSIVRFYGSRGINISSEDVFITTGVSEGISILYNSLFDPGDHVILPRPYYPIYNELSKLNLLHVSYYDFDDKGYPDIDSLTKAITKKTKAVVLINPNNPYGTSLSRRHLKSFRDTVLSHNLLLISDEIYSEIVYDGRMEYAIKGCEDERIVVLNGISKAYRVPGWRIGWAVFGTHPSLDALKLNFLRLVQLRLSPPSPFEHALPLILDNPKIPFKPYISFLKKNSGILQRRINRTAHFSVNKIDAAFYAFIKIGQGIDSRQFTRELIKRKHVVVVPGIGFGKEGYFRIVFACSPERLEEALDRICELSDELL